jgi:hypothetical protein
MLSTEYTDEIKKISKQIHNTNTIPISNENESVESVDFESYNIETLCRENVPKNLQKKFEMIVEKSKEES